MLGIPESQKLESVRSANQPILISQESPNKLDYFPLWKPQRITEKKFHYTDFKIRYAALKHSSSGFVKKPEVRRIVWESSNGKCAICGCVLNDFQVDHIISVYRAAKHEFPIECLNTRMNLQAVCSSCNQRKSP